MPVGKHIFLGRDFKPKDETERKILERIGSWTLRLFAHRGKTHGYVTSEEVMAKDRAILGNVVGEQLESLRRKAKLTQGELAEKSGLSQSTISRIEAGTKLMSLSDAKRLAPVLKCSVKFLVGGVN